MAVVAVTFNGTRVNQADANTNWGNFPSGGGAPAAEAQIAYQNGLAVNTKAVSNSLDGVDYDPGSGALDMTGATNPLWFVKIVVSDFTDLVSTFGISAGIGSSLADHYLYNLAGSTSKLLKYDQYPAQGGYILTAIDPNIAAWRQQTVGSPDLTIVDWFGGQCALVTGGAKSENFAVDAIDVGTGLILTAGDTGTDGKYTDFVAFDQNIVANRWGCCKGGGDAVTAWCLFVIGSATATEFTDNGSVVVFSDGYHSAGLVGVKADIQNASTIIVDNALLIGDGTVQTLAADDTRPDYTVSGTSGSFDFTGTMRNFRNVTFTSVCDITGGAIIECELLTQASANISNTTINTNAQTSIACLQDPTFGTTTDLHDVTFLQTGAGHAIEIDTAGTYTFTNLFGMNVAAGYGANTTDSAGLDITASTGTVTINISGGDTPTYKTAGATVNIVVGQTDFTFTVSPSITGYEWRIYEDSVTAGVIGTVEIDGEEVATVDNQTYTFTHSVDTDIVIQIIADGYEEALHYDTLTAADKSITINLEIEGNT